MIWLDELRKVIQEQREAIKTRTERHGIKLVDAGIVLVCFDIIENRMLGRPDYAPPIPQI